MNNILVIGYGNDLRYDDGIGQRVANDLNLNLNFTIKSLAVHQLTPELAETIVKADLVIFVDACLSLQSSDNSGHKSLTKLASNPDVQVRMLEPDSNKTLGGHTANPESLLAFTQVIYSYCPPALLVTVLGENFQLGDKLSSTGEIGVAIAIEKITQIINQEQDKKGTNICMKLD
ncbi:hydrogenase maturation protease [Brunnivagina elsteri CCALA 953]|uniref:Hydrogenase maturation protease n=2 Tax=Brunnivagina TaxID=3344733 RepID=A0A2A2TC48_9CYAN|nr:hydrogenase maturation protease [Calothrix elsteri CCALA 953]